MSFGPRGEVKSRALGSWGRAARFRQGIYRLLASSFLPPQKERWQQMQEAAKLLRRQDKWARDLPFYMPWREFSASLGQKEPLSLEDYNRLLGPGGDAPPWESSYLGPILLAQAEVVADLQQAYLRAGLHPTFPHGPDHISVELEFMSYLCGQEAEAWERGDTREVRRQLKREGKFLGGHLCRWLPAFVRRLEGAAAPPVLVKGAYAAWALTCHDYDLARLLDAELAFAPTIDEG